MGTFEERFLKLPRDILITVMRDHQKYFAVENSAGELQPCFVTVLNVPGDPKGTIRAGHERVLTARFSDAEFFWNADQKIPLRDRVSMLDRVTYQAKLGSYGDKIRRMEAIATELCQALDLNSTDERQARQALQLCKCDLTTQMVQEFTELQGVVGGLYAAAQGEAPEISQAIYDQYMPVGLGDSLPRGTVGAIVSLADKIDSIVAAFAVGSEPTGSSDPFSLRRQGLGVIRTIIEMGFSINVGPVIDRALGSLERHRVPLPKSDTDIAQAVWEFLLERVRYYMNEAEKMRYDTIRAVFSAGWWHEEPLKMSEGARGLERIRSTSTDFLSLSHSAKRIRNILNKSAKPEDYQGGRLDPDRLEPGAERDLYEAYARVKDSVDAHKSKGQYYEALQAIATLRPAVDFFFDKVLVMAEDKELRMNRLQLLFELTRLFSDIADLSEIESGPVELPRSSG